MRKKNIVALLIGFLAVAGILQGCTVNEASSSPQATVQGSFFPLENDILYTYVRTTNFSSYDTIVCLLISKNKFQNELENTADGHAFYSFSYVTDQAGNAAAILSTDTSSLVALDGSLQQGTGWTADNTRGIQATVVAQYDDYYLPGRQEHYTNVLEVEYHQNGQPSDTYTLRFFAAGHGLILERQIVGSSGEISRLQLIRLQYPS